MKTSYTLHQLTIGVVATDGYGRAGLAALPMLTAPAELLVDFDYTAPPRPAARYRANGDPGDEPDPQECLEVHGIESAQPLHFADHEQGVQVTISAGPGADLCRYFTDRAITLVETGLLKERRAAADEARLDAHLAGRA